MSSPYVDFDPPGLVLFGPLLAPYCSLFLLFLNGLQQGDQMRQHTCAGVLCSLAWPSTQIPMGNTNE